MKSLSAFRFLFKMCLVAFGLWGCGSHDSVTELKGEGSALDARVQYEASGLSAVALSTSQIKLSWSSPLDGNTSQVVIGVPGINPPTSCATPLPVGVIFPSNQNITSATFNGLPPNLKYAFRVCTIYSNVPTPGIVVTATSAPEVGNLSATALSTTQIQLSWSPPPGGSSYLMALGLPGMVAPASCVGPPPPGAIAPTAMTATSATFSSYLIPNTKYSFRVCTSNAGVLSPGIVVTATSAPEVGNLSATALSTTQIQLSWSPPPGGSSYLMALGLPGMVAPASCVGPPPPGAIAPTAMTATSATFSSYLIPNTKYSFRVCTSNAGVLSPGVTVTTTSSPEVSKFTGIALSTTQIQLSWSTPPNGNTRQIPIGIAGGVAPASCVSPFAAGTIFASSGTSTSASFIGLMANTKYSFLICTFDLNVPSPGMTVSVTTLPL